MWRLVVTEFEGTAGTLATMATLRLFARAREIAGTGVDTVTATDESSPMTVDAVIEVAVARYGPDFAALLPTCRIWVNGEDVPGSTLVGVHDEVAVLPPVSGGMAGPLERSHHHRGAIPSAPVPCPGHSKSGILEVWNT